MKAYFIAGTDTDAGKTVVVAALLRAFGKMDVAARAIKPVQTGCGHCGAAPDAACWQAAGGSGHAIEKFALAASPHLAARLEGRSLDVGKLADACRSQIAPEGVTLLEGAGGLYVPINEHATMLDLAISLRLPMLLVVGNRLGCINHALLSLDVMENAGLNIAGMILCRTRPEQAADAGTGIEAEAAILADNEKYLAAVGTRRGVPLLASLPFCPELAASPQKGWDILADGVAAAARRLAEVPGKNIEDQALLQFDREHLWHPYTSALAPLRTCEVVGTDGVHIFLRNGRALVDGMSSWWCALHGYGNRRMVRAIQKQAASFSHIMFGGFTHRPAVELGRRLLNLLPPELGHIFYADSGSVAVEVAIKMAVQYWRSGGDYARCRFLALRGAYHGDTMGAMSLCDPVTGMHTLFRGVAPEQLFVERPACRFDQPYDKSAFRPMEQMLKKHAHELAAVVVEPIVQGAGGMWFYHPEYLRDLRALCDELDMLLIADEIATGFGRTGKMFACEWANIVPDIMCLGKALTGGMLTFSAVAASGRVARGISAADAEHGGGVFMHGPTFMGNPLACAAACASLDELMNSPWRKRVANLEAWLGRGLAPCRKLSGVRDVRVLGAIGVVEMEQPVNVQRWQDFFVDKGVWIRPFGRTVYLMPPLVAGERDVESLCAAIQMGVLAAAGKNGQP